MPIVFKHAGHSLDLEDMPIDRWIAIQEATGMKWTDVLSGNIVADVKVAKAVTTEACRHLGVEPPELTLRVLFTLFVLEERPNNAETFTDGIPDPKAPASEPVTT